MTKILKNRHREVRSDLLLRNGLLLHRPEKRANHRNDAIFSLSGILRLNDINKKLYHCGCNPHFTNIKPK